MPSMKDVKWVAAYVTPAERKRMDRLAKEAGLDLRAFSIKRIRETEAYRTESARMFASLFDIRRKLIEDYGVISSYCNAPEGGSVSAEQAERAADEYCELADSLVPIAGAFWEWYAPYVGRKGA